MRIFCFCTGNISRTGITWNEAIDFIKKLDVRGIEIMMASKEHLYNFNLSKNNIKFVKNLDYISIHFPFADRILKKEINGCLDKTYKIYKRIGAKNVIIHPNILDDLSILKNYDMKVSLENLRSIKNITLEDMKQIFTKFQNLSFCLDISHAFSFSKYETSNLMKAFGKKLTEIHFSGSRENKDHISIREVMQDFIESIQPIKNSNVPVVIEEGLDIHKLEFFIEEIKLVKKFFGVS